MNDDNILDMSPDIFAIRNPYGSMHKDVKVVVCKTSRNQVSELAWLNMKSSQYSYFIFDNETTEWQFEGGIIWRKFPNCQVLVFDNKFSKSGQGPCRPEDIFKDLQNEFKLGDYQVAEIGESCDMTVSTIKLPNIKSGLKYFRCKFHKKRKNDVCAMSNCISVFLCMIKMYPSYYQARRPNLWNPVVGVQILPTVEKAIWGILPF